MLLNKMCRTVMFDDPDFLCDMGPVYPFPGEKVQKNILKNAAFLDFLFCPKQTESKL